MPFRFRASAVSWSATLLLHQWAAHPLGPRLARSPLGLTLASTHRPEDPTPFHIAKAKVTRRTAPSPAADSGVTSSDPSGVSADSSSFSVKSTPSPAGQGRRRPGFPSTPAPETWSLPVVLEWLQTHAGDVLETDHMEAFVMARLDGAALAELSPNTLYKEMRKTWLKPGEARPEVTPALVQETLLLGFRYGGRPPSPKEREEAMAWLASVSRRTRSPQPPANPQACGCGEEHREGSFSDQPREQCSEKHDSGPR
eukprot:RCo044005